MSYEQEGNIEMRRKVVETAVQHHLPKRLNCTNGAVSSLMQWVLSLWSTMTCSFPLGKARLTRQGIGNRPWYLVMVGRIMMSDTGRTDLKVVFLPSQRCKSLFLRHWLIYNLKHK